MYPLEFTEIGSPRVKSRPSAMRHTATMPDAPSMRVQQRLASQTIITQDFRTSVRFPIFETGYEEWPYATNGGTLFLVMFHGRVFGLTCRHVLDGFDWRQLRVTEAKFGRMFAPIRALVYPSGPRGEAVDTDLLDITLVEFAPEIGPSFFPDPPYVLDAGTCGTASNGDVLYVNGALKEKSDLSAMPISPVFCRLEFVDRGAPSTDPTLRQAYAEFAAPEFTEITGLSGSPVFDATSNKLAGMAVRGALAGKTCTLWYIDMFDILTFITAVADGQQETDYTKTVVRLTRKVIG
jgi:hypothetical protein